MYADCSLLCLLASKNLQKLFSNMESSPATLLGKRNDFLKDNGGATWKARRENKSGYFSVFECVTS